MPLAALILTFLGWGSLYIPENLIRFMEVALVIAAVGCAHPLRQVLKRARPLGWGEKIVVFSLVLALWYSSLLPLLFIVNVKLDMSEPRKLERVVLDAEERGPSTCKVKISDWMGDGSEEFHWLWLECPHPHTFKAGTSKVAYSVHKGGLGFTWVSELKSSAEVNK